MEYVNDWDQFNELFTPWQNGVIIYGFGEVAHKVLYHLYYRNMLEGTVVCIAINDVDDTLCIRHLNFPEWPDYINKMEVVDYRELPHFREDTPIFVCTSENKHEEINKDLTAFGFRKIKFLSDNFAWSLRCSVQDIEQNILYRIDFKLNELGKCLVETNYKIEEQQEVARVNSNAFGEYRNAFYGRDVVIVATGPTLKYYNPIPNAIHIGVNFAYRRKEFPLDFLFLTDYFNIRENNIYKNNPDDFVQGLKKIREKIFIGKLSRRSIYEDYRDVPADYELLNEKCVPYKCDYYISGTVHQDITTHGLMDFWSVVFSAMHFALFTNPKRIFIVGCDVSDYGHFYKENVSTRMKKLSMYLPVLKLGWLRVKKFAGQLYPNTEIVSINPVGLRALFKDVYTENNIERLVGE